MEHASVRCQQEAVLAKELSANPEVRSATETLKAEVEQDRGVRRALLAHALRLSPTLAPELAKTVDACKEKLGVRAPVELFVEPNAQMNAFVHAGAGGRVSVVLSSALLDAFELDELAWVIGHELGHHLFEHMAMPSRRLLSSDALAAGLKLQMFAWQRYAELSADRAGLECVGSWDVAGRALFKLSSGVLGLRAGRLLFDAEQYVSQIGDLRADDSARGGTSADVRAEWFHTHPFSPLRLRAVQLFARHRGGELSRDAAEEEIAALMQVMDPSYLQEKTESGEALRRLFFAAGLLVAHAHDGVSEAEVKALERFLGAGSIPRSVKPEALREILAERVARARDVTPPLRRTQVVRDLCVIATADGHVAPEEERVLLDLATALDVDGRVVETALGGMRGLD